MIFTKKNSVISKNGLTKLKPNLDQCSVLKRKINLLSFFNKTEEKPDKKIEEKKQRTKSLQKINPHHIVTKINFTQKWHLKRVNGG